mmetsp:Transcript_60751/g.113568  ORF Transcript_60751/g.113568 Transcript_60751/m.113568 type:complete len:258 (+) Transcript_60751:243-1016(+)
MEALEMPHELRILLQLGTQALLRDFHDIYSQLQVLVDQMLCEMEPLLRAFGLVEDACFRQGDHIHRQFLRRCLRKELVGELLNNGDEVVLQLLLSFDVPPLLSVRQLELHVDDLLHVGKDLGHDLMPRLNETILELHPEVVKLLDVVLQLGFEAREARGKVVLQPRLDLTGNLRHGTVHLFQEVLCRQFNVIRIRMQKSVEGHTGPLLRFPCLLDHVHVEAHREELRRGRQQPVEEVESVILVGMDAQVLCKEADHV